MSELNYTHDILKSLDLFIENKELFFIPTPYKNTKSCFRDDTNRYGHPVRYVHLVSNKDVIRVCPHCGSIHHESKGIRTVFLKHHNNGHRNIVLEVEYRRYVCKDCNHYFKDDIPFKFYDTFMTTIAAQGCLAQLRENHSMASISRCNGVSKSSIYRMFNKHIKVPHRFYVLSSVISIDEFRATTDKGTYAFHITDPIEGKTLDIVEDRSASYLIKYFHKIPYKQKKDVKIVIMDMSGPFQSIIKSIFPNATIICDRFHYVKLFRECLTKSRLDTCVNLKVSNEKLAKSIKRELHLFDKYRKDLNDEKQWYDYHLKEHFTCKSYVEYVFNQPGTEDFYENYSIYQALLKLIHEKHNDYKKELNSLLDKIFDTKNEYYISTAKNIRSKWFMPILRSLTYTAKYKRNGKTYTTSFNNGFVECMNNKVKLVKRNAFGFRYFYNFRKRVLLHLKFHYEFV